MEDILDPRRRIIDPHHHLWPAGGGLPYGVDDLLGDVRDGHRVEHTVFMECHASYRRDGAPEFRPVGETEFVADAAKQSDGLIAAIVGNADLRLSNLDDVLDAHEEAAGGLFRGIRDAIARAEPEDQLMIPGWAPAGKFEDPAFRAGLARLGERGLTYDSWHYHYQNREFLELARVTPGTTMVIDHFGTPLGVGKYASQRDEIFATWKADITEIARCENVVAKLGGMAMVDNGYGWNAEEPPSSDEFVAAQGRYYAHMIECFGADRCMFESNFPMDRMSLSYRTLWNAFKKIAAECSPSERDALFAGTAERVYRL